MEHPALSRRDECLARVREIPPGRVASYGAVGRSLSGPVSGLIVGGWLAACAPASDVPWWRVAGSDGTLLVARRDVRLALIQRERLEREGVGFDEQGRIRPEFFADL